MAEQNSNSTASYITSRDVTGATCMSRRPVVPSFHDILGLPRVFTGYATRRRYWDELARRGAPIGPGSRRTAHVDGVGKLGVPCSRHVVGEIVHELERAAHYARPACKRARGVSADVKLTHCDG